MRYIYPYNDGTRMKSIIKQKGQLLPDMTIEGNIIDTIILAGGKNSRMHGRFKGSLTYRDEVFLDRIIKGIGDGTGQIFLSCSTPGQVKDIPHKCTVIYDTIKDAGPLAGLITGISESTTDYVAVCACDMPFISRNLYEYLWREVQKLSEEKNKTLFSCEKDESDCPLKLPVEAIIPHTKGRLHPLAALYHRDILPVLTKAAANGQKKLIKVIQNLHYVTVELEPLSACELELTNINTVQEFKQLEQLEKVTVK